MRVRIDVKRREKETKQGLKSDYERSKITFKIVLDIVISIKII